MVAAILISYRFRPCRAMQFGSCSITGMWRLKMGIARRHQEIRDVR